MNIIYEIFLYSAVPVRPLSVQQDIYQGVGVKRIRLYRKLFQGNPKHHAEMCGKYHFVAA